MKESSAAQAEAIRPRQTQDPLGTRRLFWIAGGGFALLVCLVAVAAALGLLASDRIQDTAQELVRMHLIGKGGRQVEAMIFQKTQVLLMRMVWVLGFCFFLAVLVSAAMLSALQRAFRQLARQEDELAKVSWHLLDIQEKMARQFSHEIHDELGQSLLGLRRILSRIPEQPGEDGSPCIREMATGLVDEVVESARRLSQMLRPVILDDLGLDAGLRWLCESFSGRTGIAAHYQSNFEGRLDEQEETHLFRIAQEALTNVARHSGATAAWVTLQVRAGDLMLEIADNGRGLQLPPEQPRASLGMIGMRARARQIGGELAVEGRRGGGLAVRVVAPLQVKADGKELENPRPAR
ncbi:MAG: sensor histidine kinase [Bryobacteraceae bacterium]|jgi:signal transduction histidine kinase